jgi:hypothetical protein
MVDALYRALKEEAYFAIWLGSIDCGPLPADPLEDLTYNVAYQICRKIVSGQEQEAE